MSAETLEWRRVHPVTPAMRGWGIFLAALVLVGNQQLDTVVGGGGVPGARELGWSFAGLGVVLVVGLAYAVLSWRCMRYAVGEDSVHLNSGILFRQQRRARLDRLQAVDVVQPLLGRIFGLGELKLEVAGGADSGFKIGLLTMAETEALRNELLERAAGVRSQRASAPTTETSDGEGPDPAAAPAGGADGAASAPPGAARGFEAAPERPVFDVPVGRVIGSLVLSAPMIWLVVVVIGLAAVIAGTRQMFLLFAFLPGVLAFGGYVASRFAREFGFRAAISPDGIRLQHGLLETRRQTIPPGRVQAVRLRQPVLWRRADWWRVEVNVAGYGASQDGLTASVLLPVGTREQAMLALWLVLPDLGTDDPVAVVTEGLVGSGTSERTTTAPRRARWLDPWSWRRNGWSVTGRALLLRSGFFHRVLDVVPHERTQSLGLAQGPLQRRMGVVTFALHSTPGPISPRCAHLDADDAVALTIAQAARAHEAREHATPEQWMRTVSEGVA